MSATDPTTAAAGRRPSRRKSGEGRADELSEDELAMASEAQASSGDWSAGPPPGKANAFWPSFIRMLSLLMPFKRSLAVAMAAAIGSVVLTVASRGGSAPICPRASPRSRSPRV